MKNYNKTRKSNNSINSFNPSSYISKIINLRQNKNLTKVKINTPLLFHRNKYSNSLKAQNLHYNYKNNNIQKILENTDLTNDIKIHNNNSAYKTSLSTNNTNSNYYTKRRRELYKNIKPIESETTQSRNINRYNGKSLSRTTWSSFSFTEGTNNANPLINGYDYDHNMNYPKLINDNNNNNIININSNNEFKNNGYNINKLKESGIKYCIDEDGNPMNIIDIKLKNKKPIAFIIQQQNKNDLIDLDNKILIPNINGDYILNQKPYFVIKKYNVQYPELRVNNLENYNSNKENNYISINVNESNENIKYNNNNNYVLNRDINFRRKNNKSCNLYNYANLGEGLNKINAQLENNNKLIENRINVISPNNQMKKNTYKLFKNSLREKKRKYIFVNKLPDTNKSIQLKIKNSQDNNDKENLNNSIKKLIQTSNTCKNKDIDKIYFFNDNKKESISIIEKNSKNKNKNNKNKNNNKNNNNNTKLFLKNLNKLKKGINKLKDIKCFTHNEIKNLEFKFERKYKNNINSANSTQPCFLTEYRFKKIEETPKDNKEKSKIKKEDMKITIQTDNINTKNKIESEYRANTTKKYIMDNLDNLDLKKYKKKRCSYSLNQFMFNSLENNNTNNVATPQNMINTLSAFNHSFISPTTETTSYNTIQNLHMDLEKDKKRIINQNSINIKKFNSFKYYLKPKINSQKIFHKRIKTEDMNRGEKRFRFFRSLCGNNKNNVYNNSLRSFYNTESDFSVNNCKHIISNSVEKKINIFNNTNNCVCKCPYCHHLFYSSK